MLLDALSLRKNLDKISHYQVLTLIFTVIRGLRILILQVEQHCLEEINFARENGEERVACKSGEKRLTFKQLARQIFIELEFPDALHHFQIELTKQSI